MRGAHGRAGVVGLVPEILCEALVKAREQQLLHRPHDIGKALGRKAVHAALDVDILGRELLEHVRAEDEQLRRRIGHELHLERDLSHDARRRQHAGVPVREAVERDLAPVVREHACAQAAGLRGQLDAVRGAVMFDHVRFSYPDSPDKIIIKDFSAEVHPGQKVAIVGPTGAGKTTMVNLLMRFFEVNSGCITIDGVATTDLRREDVHELFGMVLQDTWLFEGTIRENLVYNMEGITDEQLETVCKACGLDKFVHSLPQGFDTVLSESTTISAGQKQLLTIARAILADNRILILDEATSSVDTRTEARIQKAMNNLMKGRTSFVIAHRLSTIKDADLILVMKDGDIIEQGTHKELLEQQGFYADLYNSQFEEALA